MHPAYVRQKLIVFLYFLHGLKFATTTAFVTKCPDLKVHKRENFLGSDFEICTFS
jgi:hypothetical protein